MQLRLHTPIPQFTHVVALPAGAGSQAPGVAMVQALTQAPIRPDTITLWRAFVQMRPP